MPLFWTSWLPSSEWVANGSLSLHLTGRDLEWLVQDPLDSCTGRWWCNTVRRYRDPITTARLILGPLVRFAASTPSKSLTSSGGQRGRVRRARPKPSTSSLLSTPKKHAKPAPPLWSSDPPVTYHFLLPANATRCHLWDSYPECIPYYWDSHTLLGSFSVPGGTWSLPMSSSHLYR